MMGSIGWCHALLVLSTSGACPRETELSTDFTDRGLCATAVKVLHRGVPCHRLSSKGRWVDRKVISRGCALGSAWALPIKAAGRCIVGAPGDVTQCAQWSAADVAADVARRTSIVTLFRFRAAARASTRAFALTAAASTKLFTCSHPMQSCACRRIMPFVPQKSEGLMLRVTVQPSTAQQSTAHHGDGNRTTAVVGVGRACHRSCISASGAMANRMLSPPAKSVTRALLGGSPNIGTDPVDTFARRWRPPRALPFTLPLTFSASHGATWTSPDTRYAHAAMRSSFRRRLAGHHCGWCARCAQALRAASRHTVWRCHPCSHAFTSTVCVSSVGWCLSSAATASWNSWSADAVHPAEYHTCSNVHFHGSYTAL